MDSKLTLDQDRRQMFIANHNACLLAENMKCCELCLFRIGISNTDAIWEEILEEIKAFEARLREIK